MAKIKTTKKAIIEAYGEKCYYTQLCNLHFLLMYDTPYGYTTGKYKYDWDFVLFDINNVAICAGYCNLIGKKIDYALARKYNDLAAQIVLNSNKDYCYWQRKEDVRALQHEFIAELCNLEKKGV